MSVLPDPFSERLLTNCEDAAWLAAMQSGFSLKGI